MFSSRILALAVALPSLCAGLKLHERIANAPHGWTVANAAGDDELIVLQIGLTQQNVNRMTSQLLDTSTPGHSCYGQHMGKDELDAMLKPKEESNKAVLSWLRSSGVKHVKSDGHWVKFATSVGNANKMLDTKFRRYVKDGATKIRTTEYSVPDDLTEHVDIIDPTTYFGELKPATPTLPNFKRQDKPTNSRATVPESCATSITPSCARQLYNVQNYTADEKSGSFMGFGSFLNQSAQYADLAAYESGYGLPVRNFSVELISGGINNQSNIENAGEADLDVQNLVGLTRARLPIVEYITGGSPPFIPDIVEPVENQNEPYLPYYQYLLSQPNEKLPQVISNSYGEDEQTVPEKYAQRVCDMIGQLTMRGISILESSGDTGVGAGCLSNDGKNRKIFTPQFPSTCPFVTSIGGTQEVNPEVAWTNGGGGFSNYFPRADYQQDAVESYFSKADTSSVSQFFNKSGRAFPDISAHSLVPPWRIHTGGRFAGSGGTSAAAPAVAGIIALLNDARLRAGQPVLGFLNPWLYSEGYKYLTDVTNGGIVGCTGTNEQTGEPLPGAPVIPGAMFNATEGWDAATGLGVPDFQKLLKAITNTRGGFGQCRH